MRKLSFSVLALVILISLSACGRGNNQIENVYMDIVEESPEIFEVAEPEAPEEEELTTDVEEIGTSSEEFFEPHYIWEVWTLAYVDVEGWKADIAQFRNFVFRVHPKFADSAFNNLPRNIEMGAAFDAHIDWLLENVPYLTKFEILVELQRASSLLEDNHFLFGKAALTRRPSSITFLHQLSENRYPLEFRWFYDGFFLYRAIGSEYVIPALNRRLVAINDISIDDVFSEFTYFWSIENIYDAKNAFAHNLNSPGILYALGVLEGRQTMYTFSGDTGERIQVNMSESLHIPFNADESWRTVFPEPLTDHRNAGELPLFLQNAEQVHWYTFIEAYGILYIRINVYLIGQDQDFVPHVTALAGEKGESLRAVIIDARNNSGGHDEPYRSLFDALAEAVPPGKLFYFMNEGSLSASLLAGGYLYELGATIIGQPSGQLIDFYAFYGSGVEFNISLRNSWANTFVSNRFYTIRDNGVIADDLIFRPHILIEYTIDDWINNRDPYLEYVLQLLR